VAARITSAAEQERLCSSSAPVAFIVKKTTQWPGLVLRVVLMCAFYAACALLIRPQSAKILQKNSQLQIKPFAN
jgi:hypothetical protein